MVRQCRERIKTRRSAQFIEIDCEYTFRVSIVEQHHETGLALATVSQAVDVSSSHEILQIMCGLLIYIRRSISCFVRTL